MEKRVEMKLAFSEHHRRFKYLAGYRCLRAADAANRWICCLSRGRNKHFCRRCATDDVDNMKSFKGNRFVRMKNKAALRQPFAEKITMLAPPVDK